uniref:COP9 signalosome complex subunit 3 n=1 Tax=Peronospora matthiolae TaxID=2874970 RepID=A0AAV1UDA2_9STRA
MEWGPLQAIRPYLASQEGARDGEGDAKYVDDRLAQLLGEEELTEAVRAASIAQLDAVLSHEAITVKRLPLSFLLLVSALATKVEQAGREDEHAADGFKVLLHVSQLFCDVPVALAMKEMKRMSVLCDRYTRLAVAMQQSISTVFALKSFLHRFHEQGYMALTPLHALFFYVCLHAKCYFAATEVLDETLVEIYAHSHLVNCVDFLGYAYYGGLLYIGKKRYQDALDFLQLAITAPAVSLSAFVIEAYKKMVLVMLILRGEAVVLPKYTPFVVTRHVESHCTAYTSLVNAFVVEKDIEAVQAVIVKNEQLFAREGNFGLVKQVVHAFKQRKVLQLTRTYATIELTEIAAAAAINSGDAVGTEKMLLKLISSGQMDAVIDKQKAMVRFVHEGEGGSAYKDELQGEATKKLQEEMAKLVTVAQQLRCIDAELVTSAKFQSRLQKDKDRRSRTSMHNQQGGERMIIDSTSGMDTME